jgi:hypothetical protein
MTNALHVETSTPRPGKRFEPIQERRLHEAALVAAESLHGAQRGLVVVPEFAGPFGVPDFTAYVGSIPCLQARQSLPVPAVVSDIDAGIVSVTLVNRSRDVRALASALGWPPQTVAGRIKRLVSSGALIERAPGRFIRPTELEATGRLYAIETKLQDWRKALRQARTYRTWADGYVLVMSDISNRPLDALLAEVKLDRGGLVVDGRWLARPRIEQPLGWRRFQASEMFASATKAGLRSPTFT